MKALRKPAILLTLLLSLAITKVYALGYVYIQGDKQTPFYVKFEGEMMERYGKNYSIISDLAPGPINIEVLFQQNVFPAQKFVVNVPENGFRGFLLMKKGDNFSLYDIHRQTYVQAGNTANDDIIAANDASTTTYTQPTEKAPELVAETIEQQPAVSNTQVAENNPVTTTPVTNSGPKFIENIELNNERTIQNAPTINTVPGDAMRNSDCPTPINSELFDAIYKRSAEKSESTRLKYLLSRMDKCYSTLQVRLLANTLPNDPERYTFLKRVYSRVTDQSAFPALENLLTAEEWKEYFRLIIP